MAKQIDAARHLFMTDRNFRVLKDKGVFDHGGRGGYDLDDCRRRYIEYLQHLGRRGTGKSDDSTEDPQDRERQRVVDSIQVERARQAAETADKLAMENRITRRELAPVAELERALADVGTLIRSRLESLSAQMKRRIPHLRASELGVVKQEVAKLSDEIASIRLNDEVPT